MARDRDLLQDFAARGKRLGEHGLLVRNTVGNMVQIAERQREHSANAPSCPTIPSTRRREQCVSTPRRQ